MRELLFKPALELAEMVRSGEVSSRELVQASLDAIEAVDGDLNAWVLVDAEQALDTADEDRPGRRAARSRACPWRSRTSTRRWPACR